VQSPFLYGEHEGLREVMRARPDARDRKPLSHEITKPRITSRKASFRPYRTGFAPLRSCMLSPGSMIRKSGHRFSDRIMLEQKMAQEPDF